MSSVPARIGSYEVVRLLGKGGMAVVYLGRDPAIDRLVAIKLLRDSLDSAELRERFAREARSAGRLRHTNIVTVFQVGEHEDAPFIVMEYVPGETLAAIMKRRPPLPLTWKLRVVEDVCRGLAYAHKAGIVHRDMKPANIQIDSDGVVKILDFGIARIGEQRAGEQELTRVGAIMGTPNYMAPEQINPGIADHRSDVFSVGLVLYELLTYTRAFGANSYTVLHNILHDEPTPIEEIVPDIDREVVAIVQRAIRKRPEERYQDLAEMRDDLRRVRRRLHGGMEDAIDEASVAAASQAYASATAAANPALADVMRWLSEAREAYNGGEFEKAVECCDRVLGVDAAHAEALELQSQARTQLAVGRARGLLAAGQEAFARGQLDIAVERIREAETLPLSGDDGATLQAQLSALRRAVTAAAERAAAVREKLARAREHLRGGELDAAAQTVDESLSIAPGHREALALRSEIRAAAAEQERQRQQQAAEQTVAEARRLAAAEDFAGAIQLLEQHQPAHPLVTAALPDILEQQAAAERRAADRRRRDEYAVRAAELLNAARAAVGQRNFSEAIFHLRSIRFGADDVASEALERLQPEADALLARSESALYLDTAADALRAGRFEDARAATALARQRDGANADVAEMDAAIDRAERVRATIDRARDAFHRGTLDDARAAVEAALAEAPDDEEALGLRAEIVGEIEQQEARRRAAADAIAEAQQLAARGEFTRAIDLLRDYQIYPDVQAALAEITEEGARRRAAREAIVASARQAAQGDFARALETLRPHEHYEEVRAAVARVVEQRASAEREADERRRREYAAGALGTVRSARAAADRGKLAEALAQLHAIRFDGDDIASPALDAVRAEADALVARCEAGQHLAEAREALAASELEAAKAAVARARERDSTHPGLAAVETAIADQEAWVARWREQQEADAAEAAEATLVRTVALPPREPSTAERRAAAAEGATPAPPAETRRTVEPPPPPAVEAAPPTVVRSEQKSAPAPAAVPPPAKQTARKGKGKERAAPPPASAAQKPAQARPAEQPVEARAEKPVQARPAEKSAAQSPSVAARAAVAAAAVIVGAVLLWWFTGGSTPDDAAPETTVAAGPSPTESAAPAAGTATPPAGSAAPSPNPENTPAPPPTAPAAGGGDAPSASSATPAPPVSPAPAPTPTPTPAPAAAPPPAPASRETVPPPRPQPVPESTPAPVVVAPPPAPAPAPTPVVTPPVPQPQPQPAVPPDTPAVTPAPAPPPAPDPAALRRKDEEAIRAVLAEYERAYAQRDPAAVRRVHPSAPANLETALNSARSYRVDIRDPQVSVQGDTATVTATRYVRVQPAAGRVQEITQAATFTLRRSPNGWIITGVR